MVPGKSLASVSVVRTDPPTVLTPRLALALAELKNAQQLLLQSRRDEALPQASASWLTEQMRHPGGASRYPRSGAFSSLKTSGFGEEERQHEQLALYQQLSANPGVSAALVSHVRRPSSVPSNLSQGNSTREMEEQEEIGRQGEVRRCPNILSYPTVGPPPRSTVDRLDVLDILCGRGGKTNHHPGNKRFRSVVSQLRSSYRSIGTKSAKTELSHAIVDHVHKYGGRFVREEHGRYILLTRSEARKKTSQALREVKDAKWTD